MAVIQRCTHFEFIVVELFINSREVYNRKFLCCNAENISKHTVIKLGDRMVKS